MEHSQILRKLRETGEYSDLTIACGPQTFKVHKCVVCLRSKWFTLACQEKRWKEGEEGVIELKAIDTNEDDEDFSCDDPEAICLMLDFIYLGDYRLEPPTPDTSLSIIHAPEPDPPTEFQTPMNPFGCQSMYDHTGEPSLFESVHMGMGNKKKAARKRKTFETFGGCFEPAPDPEPEIGSFTGIEQPKGSLTMHTRLYALAAKYDVKDLKEVATKKMREAVRGIWDREDFAKAIAVAFGATPDSDQGMRTIIIQTILSCSANLVNDAIVEKAINAVDGLPFELFKQQSTSAKRKGY